MQRSRRPSQERRRGQGIFDKTRSNNTLMFCVINGWALSPDGDCALLPYDVEDFVIILDPGGSGGNRDSRRYRVATVGLGGNGDCALWPYDVEDFVIILDPGRSGGEQGQSPLPGGNRGVGRQWRLRVCGRTMSRTLL